MNNLAISESTPLGTIVYTLEGYDPEGGNVSFGLIGSDNFMVNPRTGEVQVVAALDREVRLNNNNIIASPALSVHCDCDADSTDRC